MVKKLCALSLAILFLTLSGCDILENVQEEKGTEHSGEITQDETWYAKDNPHIITGGLQIGATLTLEPGVIVKINQGVRIDVGIAFGPAGRIIADGGDEGIIITANSDDPSPGFWNSFFVWGHGEVYFKNCTIEYGGGDNTGIINLFHGGKAEIENCTLRYSSSYGLMDGGEIEKFDKNIIEYCEEGAIATEGVGNDLYNITNGNTFSNNGYDGIVVISSMNIEEGGELPSYNYKFLDNLNIQTPEIVSVKDARFEFSANTALYVNSGAFQAENTVFTSALEPPAPGDWKGIEFKKDILSSQTWLDGCTVEYGGGNDKGNIVCYDCSPTIKNCIIRHSKAWGIYLEGEANPTLENNQFENNANGNIGP